MNYKRDSLSGNIIPSIKEQQNVIPNLSEYNNNLITFELLDSEIKMFDEGYDMDHCVYTNYYNSVCCGSYLCYHITFNSNEKATLGLRINNNKITFDQIYGKRNSSVSNEMFNLVRKILRQNNITVSKNVFNDNIFDGEFNYPHNEAVPIIEH